MALISKASLLMVPSTYEPGKLYNVLPSGNRAPDNKGGAGYDQTRADFDFDRGSNAAASRINSSGLIEKYRENELLQSNQFDTTWLNQLGGTITGGQSGYDGSSNAWLISKSASNFKSVRQVISYSGVTTFSVYAKAGTLTKAALRMDTSAGAVQIIYDLSLGVVSSSGGVFISRGIENVGNGWYRIFVSVNVSSGTNVHIYADRDGTTAGSIFIQNAQLESGLVSTDYLESTSVTGKAGVLVDLPRINYDANGENGSLLLEPQRVNAITQSEYISQLSSARSFFAINDAISPEGVQNATKWQMENTTGSHYVRVGFTTSDTYTFSVFAKKGNYRYLGIRSASTLIAFDFDTETFVGGNGTKEQLKNGWWRLSITATGSGFSYFGCHFSNASGGEQTTADGTEYYHLYGFQLEQASYPTSYIPNHGESGGVTRAADSCSVTGASDVIGQTEGTLFFDVDLNNIVLNQSQYIGVISDGSASNRVQLLKNNSNQWQLFITADTISSNISITENTSGTGKYKLAVAYKSGDVAFYINGVQEATSTETFTFGTLTDFDLGQRYDDNFVFQNPIKQTALFNERLSNAELATLTTL
jgi:hypothetical protein